MHNPVFCALLNLPAAQAEQALSLSTAHRVETYSPALHVLHKVQVAWLVVEAKLVPRLHARQSVSVEAVPAAFLYVPVAHVFHRVQADRPAVAANCPEGQAEQSLLPAAA